MDNNQENTFSLNELITMLMKNVYLIIGITILFAVVVGLYTQYGIERKYESKTVSAIVSEEDTTTQTNSDDFRVAEQLAERYAIISRSDTVLSSVKADLKTIHKISMSESAIKNTFSITSEAAIVTLTVEHTDFNTAQILASLLTEKTNGVYVVIYDKNNVKIIDPAMINDVPVSPNLKLNVLIGFVIGGMVSVGIVLLKELVNRKVLLPKDIEEIGIPYLGSVPDLSKYKN